MTIRYFEDIYPTIDDSAYIDEMALVSGAVTIGADSSVWPMAAIRGDVNSITIGVRSNIQDGAVLHVTAGSEFSRPEGYPLTIGNDVTIGHAAVLHACTIGDRCLIGMGAIILDGAVLEDDVVVGAGSLVPPGKVLTRKSLWLGSPAKEIRPLKAQELRHLLYSSKHYVNLAARTRTTYEPSNNS